MAIITKIRERTVLVLGIVGLALLAFILGDLFSSNASLFAPDAPMAGEIDGEPVLLSDFSTRVERTNREMELKTGSNLPAAQMGFIRNQVWDDIVAEMTYKFEEMGIQVTDDEIRDMVQGNNVHPEIIALFTNPETRQFDRQILLSFLQNPDRYPAQVRNVFAIVESGLRDKRRESKYLGMLHKTNYVTEAEAKFRYKAKSTTADIEYVYVPFNSIPDSTVNVTEDELKAFFEENKSDYLSEAMLSMRYVQFRIDPSAADSAVVRQELEDLKVPFENTEDDTLFTSQYSDARQGIFAYNRSELPEVFTEEDLQPGKVIGPIQQGNAYRLYKFIGQEEDTVFSARASHILFSTSPDMTDEQKEEKRKKAEEVLAEARNGGNFALLASQHSEGPTKTKGGDLGWFKEGAMVEPFEEAVFGTTEEGVVPRLVETRFGYHIINVTKAKTKDKYVVGMISRLIEASEETRDEAFRKAGRFAVAKNTEEYTKVLEQAVADGEDIISIQANNIGKTQSNINDLNDFTGVRNLINWGFKDKTRPGDVSDVVQIGNRFVVAVLTEKVAVDDIVPTFSIVREEVRRDYLKQRKAEQIIAKLKENSGASFEEMTGLYERASTLTQEGITFSFMSLRGMGAAPKTIGRTFAQEVGTSSEPYADENGVVVLKVVSRQDASEVADYTQYRNSLSQERSPSIQSTSLKSHKAVSEITGAKKYLYKYY